jgi:hypothetical protein
MDSWVVRIGEPPSNRRLACEQPPGNWRRTECSGRCQALPFTTAEPANDPLSCDIRDVVSCLGSVGDVLLGGDT